MSKITLNIVDPSSSTPINPGTDPIVPNTGLFTHGIGGPEATIILGAVLILAIVSIVLAAYMYRRHKKAGKTTKLVHIVDQCKGIVASKKRVTAGLAAIALLVSTGTFIALARNGVNATDAEPQAEGEDSLTVEVSDTNFTIEVGDEPVFAVLPVELTVAEATQAGYTLTAYAEDTDLVSTTDPDNIIPMVTVDSEEALVALTDNTYGLSLVEPEAKDEEVYTALSTDSSTPTFITDKDYSATAENDTTTIYYGFYVTPDVPYGTYTGGNITVDALPNIATVAYDANGLYYNDDEASTINIAGYKPNVAEAHIELITGEYSAPAPLTTLPPANYTFLGWSEDESATEATYSDEQDILENLSLLPNEKLILYAVWHYNTALSFDGNGSDGGTAMEGMIIPAGNTITLPANTYTKDGYNFTGWNTVAEPTEQEPGETYADQADYTAPATSQYLTLYAQWEKPPVIGDLTYMQDFATLSETGKTSVLNSMTAGEQYQLKDNRDQKDYYISKLADGNIWMTQNLDFNIVNGGAGLDSTNTDVPANWADAGNLTNTYNDNTWEYSTTTPESYDPGNLYWNGELDIDGTLDNMTTSTGDSHHHIGNYYNWTAAVAMNDSSSYTTEYEDVNQSICPAGWRLPTYSGDKSYQNLVNMQGLTSGTSGNIQNTPAYFVYGGYWAGISGSVGAFGLYWSSVVINDSNSALLHFDSDGLLNPQRISSRNDGYSLRCVAR